jgi:hypothetical protein
MASRLTIDFVTEFLDERQAILKQISGARMTAIMQDGKITEPEIELDFNPASYSRGELEVIQFVQTPTRPVDLSRLSGDLARKVLDLHFKFWSKKLQVTSCLSK